MNPASAITFTALGAGYTYQYVIERLCDITGGSSTTDVPSANIPQYCFSQSLASGNNSQEARSAQLGAVGAANEIAYRTTVRVSGPHNASTMVQAVFMKN